MTSKYACLCYHYIRTPESIEKFPRIMGLSISQFENHIKFLKNDFILCSLNDINSIHSKNKKLNSKIGLHITFDDGLSDHFLAAKILEENNISATFFIPSCIISDKTPANPMIIHYVIANYGIKKFLKLCKISMEKFGINFDQYNLNFIQNKDNVWEKISLIKETFKYKIDYVLVRKILLDIYHSSFDKDYSNGLDLIHLNENQISKMIQMGHSIGTHSHSHISINYSNLSKFEFHKEIIKPKHIFESKFNTEVISFSYPFGEKSDYYSSAKFLDKTMDYNLAFTVEERLNNENTSPFEIGRCQPVGDQPIAELNKKLKSLT